MEQKVTADNADLVGGLIRKLGDGMTPFVTSNLLRVYGAGWPQIVQEQIKSSNFNEKMIDPRFILLCLTRLWNDVWGNVLPNVARNYAYELINARNKWAHHEHFSDEDTYRAIDTMERLLQCAGATVYATAIKEVRQLFLLAMAERLASQRKTENKVCAWPTQNSPNHTPTQFTSSLQQPTIPTIPNPSETDTSSISMDLW
eukprot:TRINITY_DN8853_c0_g1_i1.p1 TRINITY_DN8853_c0_g1~~TRINITY_DN8853_c0_g1_i1.p1  ORF type:complete len:201 (+),score=18.52 TRINITY_DN8853_c0_g1_i1:53-655(+)